MTLHLTVALFVSVFCYFTAPSPAFAQTQSDWVLQSDQSTLRFQTIKNGSVIETNRFRKFDGAITADGQATINIMLDSVDTKVDLRNVRLRFLLFETFNFPTATITAQVAPNIYDQLREDEHIAFPLRFALTLHGHTQRRLTDVIVTKVNQTTVSVSTVSPVPVGVADFGLRKGLDALELTANVDILPAELVTFSFLFTRDDPQ
ncbi:MAG: YceI family protein [Yoonia sp.]|nr:YceI family protein [Yoonia sp.]